MSVLPSPPDGEASFELNAVFGKAKKAFLDSLNTEEQTRFSGCSSSQNLLDEVKKFEVIAKAKQRGLRFAQKIQSLSDNLSPYFKIIEIFCGAHPEYANLAWGALRLILQLASNFATFFEKLCDAIQKLSLALPQFEDVFKSLKSVSTRPMSQRLENSMVLFYSDLFEFFQATARVFSDKKGTLKRTPVVIGGLLWKPFDVRFQDILNRMRFHQKLVKEELHWQSMSNLQRILHDQVQNAEDTREHVLKTSTLMSTLDAKFDQEQRSIFCASILKWLEPPHFTIPFEQAQDSREDGTAEWLFEDLKFEKWRKASDGSILWVQGNPGWGKTVLAASTVEELHDFQRLEHNSLPVVCYYFFYQDINQKASRLGAYRALVTQLFQQCNQIKEIYDIFTIANNGVKTAASEHELLDLLRIILAQLSNVYFIIDSIDECKDNAKFLQEISGITSSSHLKTVLFSRPNVACLRRSVGGEQKISMSRETLDKDIAIFLDRELLSLQHSFLLPADFDVASAREILMQRADGMFLWARLMICYLNSAALTRGERMEEISKSTPEGLEDMYLKIFDHIKSMDPASRQLASRVFMWVGYARSHLTSEQMKEIVWGMQSGPTNADPSDDVDHGIIVSCCGLVEKRQSKYFHFIHLTAQEFILSPRLCSDSGSSFVLLDNEAAFEMSQRCISYLMFSVPARPLGGDIHNTLPLNELNAKHPFLEYVIPHWAEHAKDALPQPGIGSNLSCDKFAELGITLEKFTAAKLNLMVWVEATYIYGAFSSIHAIDGLARVLAASLKTSRTSVPTSVHRASKELTDLAFDLKAMDASWRTTLLARPQEIWNDVTVFSPSRFFVRTSAANVAYLTPQGPADFGHSEVPLFSTSSNSADGQQIASLSIWPSRTFSEFWKAPAWDCLSNPLPENRLDQLHAISEGWNARYELFTLDCQETPQCTVDLPLESTEISLLLRQSLRSSCLRHWSLSFPMLISKNLTTVIVLRTIFQLDPGAMAKTMTYCSSIFPLQSSSWSQSQPFFKYTYSYDWLISSDSRFVVHHSFDRNPGSHSEPLTVFHIGNRDGLKVDRLKTINHLKSNPGDYTFCAIHPQRANLIFTARSAIWLADLEREMNIIKILDLQQNLAHSPRRFDGSSLFHEDSIKEIGFSACGTYFTVAYKDGQWPQIYPLHIPDSTSDVSNVCQTIAISDENHISSRKRKVELEMDEFDGRSTLQISKMPKAIHTGCMVLDHQTDSSNIQASIELSHEAEPQSIELVTRAQDLNTRALSLARIPNHIDIKHTKSTVLWPSDEYAPVQIILNASTKSSYDSDEIHTSPFLPAILSRDPQSLAPFRQIEPYQQARICEVERLGQIVAPAEQNTSEITPLYDDLIHVANRPDLRTPGQYSR